MSRVPVIAGNWKMNTTPSEGAELASDLKDRLSGYEGAEVIIAPPFTHLFQVGAEISDSPIKLASQNMSDKESGAYTGEISPKMLIGLGCEYVIIGHSERRQYFGETDFIVNAKLHTAIKNGIKPIICIGETLDERDKGQAFDVVSLQLDLGLANVEKNGARTIIIAYEPVWAIGTGKTASDDQAQEIHGFIREKLEKCLGTEIASETRILYGGSVKRDNVDGLMAKPDIDGALVGGASLNAESFERIVKFKEL